MAEGIGGLSDAVIREIQYAIKVNNLEALAALRSAIQGVEGASKGNSEATQTYAVAANAGTSAAQMFTQSLYGYTVGAVQAAGAAKQFAQSVEASSHETEGAAAANRMYSETLDAMASKTSIVATRTTQVYVGMQDGTRASRVFAGGLTQVAYALDDLQYGLVAIVNNIPGLARGIGLTEIWAGALGIAAVAGNQFAKQVLPAILEAFTDVKVKGFDPNLTAMENLQERIKELDGKKIKLAVEREELDKAKESLQEMKDALEAYEAVRTGRSKSERESQSAVKEALADPDQGGGKAVTDALTKRAIVHIEETNPDLAAAKAKLAKAREDFDKIDLSGESAGASIAGQEKLIADAWEEVNRIRQEIRAPKGLAAKAVGEAIGPAKPGDDVGEHQERLAGELDAAGFGDLAANIRQKNPAAMRATEENKKRKEARDKENKERADLTQQGIDNQYAAEQEVLKGKEKDDKDADRAKKDRERDIKTEAGKFDNAAMMKGLGREMRRHSRDDPDAVDAQLRKRVGEVDLKGQVPDDIVTEVAAEIVAKARTQLQASQAARGGKPVVLPPTAREVLKGRVKDKIGIGGGPGGEADALPDGLSGPKSIAIPKLDMKADNNDSASVDLSKLAEKMDVAAQALLRIERQYDQGQDV